MCRRVIIGAVCLLLARPLGGTALAQNGTPVLPPPARREPAAPACPAPLTLPDLEHLALANNPTIPAAEALVRQQEGLWTQAGLYPNPTAGYLRTDPNQPGQSETQGVFLSQDLVTAGKLRLARAEAAQEIDWRTWQMKAQRERVLNDVRMRYIDVLGAQQAEAAAAELEGLAQKGVTAAQQLLQAKHGSRADVLQAEIQLSIVRASLQDARHRHLTAWRQLTSIVGVPGLPPGPLTGNLEARPPALDWQTSLEQLLAASPVLRAQEAQIRAAGFDVRLARAQAVPNVNFQVVVQHDQVQKFNEVSTLVSMPIPVFNRNQGNIRGAQAVLQQQKSEYERVCLALTDTLAVAFQQYLTSRDQAERLDKEILPRAKENLDLTTRAYQLGQFDFLRVLAARQTYFETRLAYIDALTALHKIVIEIRGLELTGGLNPTEVGTALQTQAGTGPAGARNVLLQQLQREGLGGGKPLPGAIQATEH